MIFPVQLSSVTTPEAMPLPVRVKSAALLVPCTYLAVPPVEKEALTSA